MENTHLDSYLLNEDSEVACSVYFVLIDAAVVVAHELTNRQKNSKQEDHYNHKNWLLNSEELLHQCQVYCLTYVLR